MKTCTKCDETKPLTEFNRNRRHSDGFAYACRTCSRASSRLRYATNTRNCAVTGCVRTTVDPSKRMCGMHVARVSKHGEPGPAEPINRLGDQATYDAVHMRLRARRGSASAYLCVDCGEFADHWSYDNSCSNEKVEVGRLDSRGPLRYSLDMDSYEPRCAQCHKAFDMNRSNLVSA